MYGPKLTPIDSWRPIRTNGYDLVMLHNVDLGEVALVQVSMRHRVVSISFREHNANGRFKREVACIGDILDRVKREDRATAIRMYLERVPYNILYRGPLLPEKSADYAVSGRFVQVALSYIQGKRDQDYNLTLEV